MVLAKITVVVPGRGGRRRRRHRRGGHRRRRRSTAAVLSFFFLPVLLDLENKLERWQGSSLFFERVREREREREKAMWHLDVVEVVVDVVVVVVDVIVEVLKMTPVSLSLPSFLLLKEEKE